MGCYASALTRASRTTQHIMSRMTRQKGNQMTKETEYRSLKLVWGQVSMLIGQMASTILHRTVRCRCSHDDYDYWSADSIHGRFTVKELTTLLDAVGATGEDRLKALMMDTQDTASLDMDLCRALLMQRLRTTCLTERPCEDGLWLIGVDTRQLDLPAREDNILFVDGIAVDLRTLWTKDEFAGMLFDAGGTVGDLSEICKRYVNLYGNELYWSYPITDGRHNGVLSSLLRDRPGVLRDL